MTTAFNLLSEPNRRRIIEELGRGECPVNTLVTRLEMSQPAVSKHLRVLREAGLAVVRRQGQQRIYRLDTEPLKELDEWLAPFRAYWGPRVDALEQTLDSMED